MLKQLIQRLLDSRTTPSEAAHNASSIYTEPTWFNGTPTVGDSWTDNLYTGTAPSDGYLNVSGSANINTANAGSMIQAKISGAQISQVTPMAGQGFNMMAPISKGATFSVNGIRLADITVRFFKSIGGGYNRFVRRALPCLRPSFNYLPRSFCKANIPTLLINADQVQVHKARQSQETARRISWLHSQVGLSLRLAQTVRQTTHGLGLKTPPEELHTSPMQFANTKRLLSQCKKEMFLLLTSALITRTKAPFCLSPLKQQNNLQTGGASC